MKSNRLSLKKLALIAIPAGIVVGVIIHFAFPPRWTHISFDVDLKAPDDLEASIVLTQPGRPDTTLGTYQGDQSIHFGAIKVLRKDRDGIIVKAVPASDQAEATPAALIDPRNKSLEFVLEWHDVSRIYQILVKDSRTAAGVPGARVWTSPDSSLASGTTDAGGSAVLTVKTKPGTRFYFYARQPDYVDGNAEAINQQQGDLATAEISLQSRPGRSSDGSELPRARMEVKVLVIYEGTQEVITGAQVSTIPRELSQTVQTDQGGEAGLVIDGALNQQFSVKASYGADAKTSSPLFIKGGDTQSLTLAIPKIQIVDADYFVLVKAGDEGEPAGIQVTANPGGLSATTDENGRAAFLDVRLKPGTTITFGAVAPGGKRKTASINHKLGGGKVQLDLSPNVIARTFTFHASCTAGLALEGVQVSVRDRGSNLVYGKGMTGGNGDLQISAAVPARAELDYRATAPAQSEYDWSGDKLLAGRVPGSAQTSTIELTFPCAAKAPETVQTNVIETPQTPTDPKKPAELVPKECNSGDAHSRITCLYGLRKFEAVLQIPTDKLTGEKLSEAHLYRGYSYEVTGEAKKAVQEFQAVIAAKSARAGSAYLEIGKILMNEGDWAKAIDQFDSALGMNLSDENKGLLYYNYGTCKYMQSQFSKSPKPLLAAAQEKLNLAQDYLCNERMANRHADLCQEISAALVDIRNRQSK